MEITNFYCLCVSAALSIFMPMCHISGVASRCRVNDISVPFSPFPPFMVFKYLAERRRRRVQAGCGRSLSSFLEGKDNWIFELNSRSVLEIGEPLSCLTISESNSPNIRIH